MTHLNGWQRLWLVGLVPWILLNISILAEAINLSWLTGWWELLGSTPFPAEPAGILLFAFAVVGILLSYLALTVGVYVVWRTAEWIRAGFQEGEQQKAEDGTTPSDDPAVEGDVPLKSREAGA